MWCSGRCFGECGFSWTLLADTGAAGAPMISRSPPTPLCLMPSMHVHVLPIPAPCPAGMRSPARPTPRPARMRILPFAPMPSAHALPHPHAQHASARPPTMPSAHALLHPTPAQLLFPGHQVLTCFPGRLGPTSGGCSPAASHRQTWHPGRHSAESPESSSVKPKQKVIGLPWE